MHGLFEVMFYLTPPLLLLGPECDPIHSLLVGDINFDSLDSRRFGFKFLHSDLLYLLLDLLQHLVLLPLRFDFVSAMFIRNDSGLSQF